MTATLQPTTVAAPWGPIGKAVYERTYSRPLWDGKEDWPDTVRRVVQGNAAMANASIEEQGNLTDAMMAFKTLPAGRHLWVTGVDGVPAEARRNCWRAPFTKRLADHFEFTGSMLLLGGGVGANYSREYLALAEKITPFQIRITCSAHHSDYEDVKNAAGDLWLASWPKDRSVVVDDSREGWVAAWGLTFDAATRRQAVVFDLSDVRPAGATIKTFGGTASGPGPLASSLAGISTVLQRAVNRKLTGLEAMDCDHAIASAVVAGGARRSARMSIMHWKDPEILSFIQCKQDHTKHWTTNISVEIDEGFLWSVAAGDELATAVLNKSVVAMHDNGEPGFYNVSLASAWEHGDIRATNPCGEVPLEQGESCNIGSVNLDAIGTNDAEAEAAFRLMTRFLLRQTLSKMSVGISDTVETTNRRIGVGFLGLQGWAAAHGVRYADIPKSEILRSKLRRFRMICRDEAKYYAYELGISEPIKVTAVAPNGSIAHLPGTQPGAHPILMRYGVRNVRYSTGDSHISDALDAGLKVEPCIYAENTWVVSYPMADTLVQRFSTGLIQQVSEISVNDQLAVLACVTEEFCGGLDGNGVSFTASFDPDSITAEELSEVVLRWLPFCKGITAFPTASRPQAPYIPTTESEYLMMTDRGARDTGDTGETEIASCVGGACPIR